MKHCKNCRPTEIGVYPWVKGKYGKSCIHFFRTRFYLDVRCGGDAQAWIPIDYCPWCGREVKR